MFRPVTVLFLFQLLYYNTGIKTVAGAKIYNVSASDRRANAEIMSVLFHKQDLSKTV